MRLRALLMLLAFLVAGIAPAQRDGPPVRPLTGPSRTAQDLSAIESRVRAVRDPRLAAAAIPQDLFDTPGLERVLNRMRAGEARAREDALGAIAALRLASETRADADALAKVRRIKEGAEYRTPKNGSASTWFGRMLEGFSRWIQNTLRKMFGSGPNIDAPNLNLSMPGWVIYVVWTLIAIVVLLAAWPLIRLIRFRIERRRRKAKGILDEEPERTKSEYLTLGDEFAARGDFRGAIRMRYLAALKRFDEARVARFDRGETNWEHLARIRSSPTLPTGLDFRPATAAFDHYWYGFRPAGQADYDQFVAWYDEVDRALRVAVAA